MSAHSTAGVALVSGANRGIGREVGRQLAERGYAVLLGARDEAKGRAAAEEIGRQTGADVRALALDVASPQGIAAAAAQVSADPGRLDVLVNNAGVGSDFGVSGAAPDFEAMGRALEVGMSRGAVLIRSAMGSFAC